jgi:glutathione S-transferase
MRILFQFPLSHYCEKARWLLDHKELDYVAKNMIPGAHRLVTRWHASNDTLPLLKDEKTWIGDSTEIAFYLDGMYAEKPLMADDPKQRSAIIELDKKANALGYHVRRWMYLFMIDEPSTMDIMLGERGFLHGFKFLMVPVIKKGVKKLYRINPETAAQSKVQMDLLIDELEAVLLANGADGQQGYLVGKQFSFADISVCALTAPLLGPIGTPWVVSSQVNSPEPIEQYKTALLARPLGQYVMRVYANDRKAKVDWRGQ